MAILIYVDFNILFMVLKDSVALYMASQAHRVSRKLPVLIELYGVSKLYLSNITHTFTDHPARRYVS